MKLIYLHLYKDTYLIFMQAYKPLRTFLHYYKYSGNKKMCFPLLKVLIKSRTIFVQGNID